MNDINRVGTNGELHGQSESGKGTGEREPIAIIGIGCRYPGEANSPAAFWSILRDGRDVLTEIPPDRWSLDLFYDPQPGRLGRTNVRFGGFLKGIDQFDAHFFGISPREAAFMDPQQRLLLEVAWEALEDGGQALERISGTNTAVFVGISSFDYAMILNNGADRDAIDVYSNTGGALSIAANRISYCFNFKGPSGAVDTACSSSLFAAHLACETLWNKTCPLALVGGVHVLISPDPYIGFSRLNMLSADGRCKAFDARGNGFVRSEGAGVVVLKPLSAALADGDRIYALIRATAMNQDGRTSGLTVPSQQSQAALVRQACEQAGVDPRRVQFVEAHGTGTPVGDPIEARALGEVLGAGRSPDKPCLLGSVKTNIGHLEAGAGMAGLVKATLALHHRQIPPNLHFEQPNPNIPFEELRLRVPVKLEPWPEGEGPALAGVNSFGFGGTNAHVILEEAPAATDGSPPAPARRAGEPAAATAFLVPLSARSEAALTAAAGTLAAWLEGEGAGAPFDDICRGAALRRSHHDHRLAVVARTREELAERLRNFAAGEADPDVIADHVVAHQGPKLAFVFSGQGPQWWAMGRQLLATATGEPVFQDMIERCDRLMRPLGEWSLLEELTAEEDRSRLHVTAIAQPALFAIQVALAALWESWGIKPDAVIGHSVGEAAAAYVAGALSLEDAVRVIFHRGRCMECAPTRGRMLAVGLSRDEAEKLVRESGGLVFLAAVNSPTSMTLSGQGEALETLAQQLQQRQVFQRFLQVQYAFHSAQMDPVREPLLEALRDVRPRTAQIPLYSTVDGKRVEGPELTGEYWWRNVRQTVLFADVVEQLLETEHTAVVELSPHPVLAGAVAECFQKHGKSIKAWASLRRKEDERPALLRALGGLYAAGRPLDWSAVAPAGEGWVRLPTYSWQHESFWHEAEESRESRLGKKGHPLLGGPCHTPDPSWESIVDSRMLPYLADHRVQGVALLPTTGYLEMGLAAARQVCGPGTYVLEEVKLLKPCFLPPGQTRTLRTGFRPEDASFDISSRPSLGAKTWITHVRGVLAARPEKAPETPLALDEIKGRCRREISGVDCYAQFKKVGLDYGPLFQGLDRLWQGNGESLGLIRLPEALVAQLEAYHCHPSLLDGCLQAAIGVLPENRTTKGAIVLPVEIDQVRVFGRLGREVWSHARLVEINRQMVASDVRIYDEKGQLVVEMRGLQCQIVGGGGSTESLDDLLYEYQWQFKPRGGQEGTGANRGRRSVDYLPGLGAIRDGVQALVERAVQENAHGERAVALQSDLNHLCALYVEQAFRKMGACFRPGERFTAAGLREQLGIVAQHHRLLGRYLNLMQDEGLLRQEEAEWVVERDPVFEDPEPLWRDVLSRNPAFFAEATLIRRCGLRLHEVLRGEANPLQLIFPEGSLATAEHLYQDSPSMRFSNTLAQEAIRLALAKAPPGRTVRVLEIGAGTGGLTSYVLPWLPPGRTEYVFTDLSNHFFLKAEPKFADYPFVKYQKLDIEKSPAEQGFSAHSFDVVLASQVLHATLDLRQTLAGVRQLLAPEGMLVLLEIVKPACWLDLVFGLTEGWWRFTDADLRQSYPLLSFSRWQALLAEMGFTETVDAAGTDAPEGKRFTGGGLESAVILSRGPALREEDPPKVAPLITRPEERGGWLFHADRGGAAERLAALLRDRGERCVLVFAGEVFERLGEDRFTVSAASADESLQLVRAVLGPDQPPWRGLVHLWNLDAPDVESMPGDASAHQTAGCLSVVNLIQAWNDAGVGSPRLWLVTRQTQTVGTQTDRLSLLQTPVWGLGRVVINECPRLRCKQVDLGDASEMELQSLVEELWAPDEEDEISLRGEARYVHRYIRTSLEKQGGAAREDKTDGPSSLAAPAFRLEVSRSGVLDGLTLRETERPPPGPGEVEIRVVTAALNFSDVMKALGLYPGLPDGPVPLGIECAGRIAAVGAGVEEFRVGDEVLAIAAGSFGAYVNTPAALTAHKPEQITFEEAATIPIAFLTAVYSLDHLGRSLPGERVLIHAASGGVGLAAIQVARRAGATVLATAGNPEKRQFLQALGVEHVMDSRSLAFADEVMAITGGRGVDVVLNSLAGAAIPKGLACLADYGRFLEIGKRDIYGNSRIGLKPFRKNLSFFAIDLDRAMRERPAVLAALFRRLMQDVRDGRLAPLPHRVFAIDDVVGAFRCLSQAKHIGKVVVSLERRPKIAPKEQAPLHIRSDATYLLTGGLGGFGLAVAQWLVEQGARHLVLMGRRGVHSPEVEQQVATLRQTGAEVVVAQADVSKREDVARVLADVARSMPPLRGVLHAAMVLDDSLLLKMDRDRWMRVMTPKIDGAWELHRQTLNIPLDCFVLFSSMTSMFGLPGQGNYAASNAFLDGLARYRRYLGLPALSVSWGPVAEAGYVARNEKVVERFEGQGVKGLTLRQSLALLSGLLRQRAVHVGATNIDWSAASLVAASGAVSPRFAALHKAADVGAGAPKQDGLAIRKTVLAVQPDKRLGLLVSFLRDKVARVLGATAAKVVVDKPLTELGLDSLMAVELRNWIEGELRVNLPIVELMQGPSITRLAELLLVQLTTEAVEKSQAPGPKTEVQPSSPEDQAAKSPGEPSGSGLRTSEKAVGTNGEGHKVDKEEAKELLADLEKLSDAEVDSLLNSMLAGKEQPK
jgi:acyl transferase domain-containing protein/NADPH:quinone reductase-like Zn-dependent oxidoreductase/SAM-dependent methyltransferase/aryl carrier-like protein